ncbi:MAG TPA: peroxiredoxin [Buchnera sp. (in: enterobacteria)]|nr:peroxiredoxin [Buchnera sp. (in: enterobacteria)]
MVLINQKAPNFIAPAISKDGEIINSFNLKDNIDKNGAIIFFWPLDFTFVCPTEILEFNLFYKEFKKRKIELIGISIDSVFTHNAWRNTEISQGGIGSIQFFMVSDIKREIQKLYDVEHKDIGVSLRATFIIDKNQIIRHQSINDLPIGRNVKEILRIADAIHFNNKNGEVCPVNWKQGDSGIIPNSKGIKDYFRKKMLKNK